MLEDLTVVLCSTPFYFSSCVKLAATCTEEDCIGQILGAHACSSAIHPVKQKCGENVAHKPFDTVVAADGLD